MPGCSHRCQTVFGQSALRQYGIYFTRYVRTTHTVAAEHHLGMSVARTSFGTHQVICPVDMIQMRTFYLDRFVLRTHAFVYDLRTSAHNLVGGQIVFPQSDGPVTVIFGRCVRFLIVDDIGFPVR